MGDRFGDLKGKQSVLDATVQSITEHVGDIDGLDTDLDGLSDTVEANVSPLITTALANFVTNAQRVRPLLRFCIRSE